MILKTHIVLAFAGVSFIASAGEVPPHTPPGGWTPTHVETGAGYGSPDGQEMLWVSPLVPLPGDPERAFEAFSQFRILRKGLPVHGTPRGLKCVFRQDRVEVNGLQINRLGAAVARGGQGVIVFLFSQRSAEETRSLILPVLLSLQLPEGGVTERVTGAPQAARSLSSDPRFESSPQQWLPLAEVTETAPLCVSLVGDWVSANGISIETLERRTPTYDVVHVKNSSWGIVYSFRADGTYQIVYITKTGQGMAGNVDERGRWRLAGDTIEMTPASSKLVIMEANVQPWVKEELAPARALSVRSVRLSFQVGAQPARENGGIQVDGPCAPWMMDGSCSMGSPGTVTHTLQRLR